MNIFVGILVVFVVSPAEALLGFPDYKNHPCKRTCNGQSMTCVYNLTIEIINVMEPTCGACLTTNTTQCFNEQCIVADGAERIVFVINRLYPGPQIEVCQNDFIIANVYNHLQDISTSIHWHGLHQRQSPYMDGVPMITQWPIPPATTFQYRFRATEPGTHFYHSHSGLQRANGLFGHLIVKVPDSQNGNRGQYDFDLSDHVISANDWQYQMPLIHYQRFYREKIFEDDEISTIIINGFGSNVTNRVPPRKFVVQQNRRYRFRLIHAGFVICPIELKIQGHNMTVISTDGDDIQPVTVDTLYLTNGERMDFVVNANKPVMTYWMQFRGLITCNNKVALALLEYQGSTMEPEKLSATTVEYPENRLMNCINIMSDPRCISYTDVRSLKAMPTQIQRPIADYIYYMGLDIYPFPKRMFEGTGDFILNVPALNNITMNSPDRPLLHDSSGQRYCNADNTRNCERDKTICECVHLVEIPLNSMVEFIIVDEGLLFDLQHPMHLHGFNYWVIGHEKLGTNITTSEVRRMNGRGQLKRNLSRGPVKDTISPPDGGYSIVRFIADNPGYWFFHCHVEHHTELGMAMVLKVGNRMPIMPNNYPTCGLNMNSDYYDYN